MKIQLKAPVLERQESFSLFTNDDIFKDLLTPSITNACHEFIQSLPTPQINLTQINTSELMISDLQTPNGSENNPFIKTFSASIRLNPQQVDDIPQVQNQISVEAITLDHDYILSDTKKQKNSEKN